MFWRKSEEVFFFLDGLQSCLDVGSFGSMVWVLCCVALCCVVLCCVVLCCVVLQR